MPSQPEDCPFCDQQPDIAPQPEECPFCDQQPDIAPQPEGGCDICDQQPQIDSPFGDFGGGIGGDFDNISQGPGEDMMPGGFGDDMNIFVSGSSAQ